ncbi:thymidine kinase [Thermoplasma sp. Kam2015]|uniref:thymidine kinase n=1 Tax=Thermoplasma sp. Kam2015 TaxID=2094122 RepID=UPI000D8CC5C5|nr:thymidine kinase [Thermoplasma sp. Kam2015]PYB67818.1 thymidine kinase [Thermoplasma sp. Kam2015]
MSGNPGKIITITGPMFSGKTSRLIELMERHILAGRNVTLFKPEIDSRYSENEVVTHKGMKLPAIIAPTDERFGEFLDAHAKNSGILGFDEAQFWKPSARLPQRLEDLANSGRIVYVAALNRDHFGNPFRITADILAISDEIYVLSAVCSKCGNDAIFTQRIINGVPAFGEIIRIGGKDLYEPRCRNCFVWPSTQMRIGDI